MSGNTRFFLFSVLFLEFVVATQVLSAQPSDLARSLQEGISDLCPSFEQYSTQRPDPQGRATPVWIAVSFVDILSIDDSDQTFTVDAWLLTSWKDSRLADQSRGKAQALCEIDPGKLWTPRLQIRNLRELETQYPDVMLIDSEGIVTLARRSLIKVFSKFDLKEFPFDQQNLTLTVESLYGINDMELHAWNDLVDAREATVAGWRLGDPIASAGTEQAKLAERSIFSMTVIVDREPSFFARKLFVPVSLIVFMAYAIFWISPSLIAPQTGIGATSMLTLIAYQFALSNSLPRISYLTRADFFLLWALVLVFAALAEAIATAALMNYGKEGIVRKMDWCFRGLYPLAFVLIVVLAIF
jgi:hypothetical protein